MRGQEALWVISQGDIFVPNILWKEMELLPLTFSLEHTHKRSSCIHRPIDKHSESVSNEQLKNTEASPPMGEQGFPPNSTHHGGIWRPSAVRSHRLSRVFPSDHIYLVSCRSSNYITPLTKPPSHVTACYYLANEERGVGCKSRSESETTNIENNRLGGYVGGQWERFVMQKSHLLWHLSWGVDILSENWILDLLQNMKVLRICKKCVQQLGNYRVMDCDIFSQNLKYKFLENVFTVGLIEDIFIARD